MYLYYFVLLVSYCNKFWFLFQHQFLIADYTDCAADTDRVVVCGQFYLYDAMIDLEVV